MKKVASLLGSTAKIVLCLGAIPLLPMIAFMWFMAMLEEGTEPVLDSEIAVEAP